MGSETISSYLWPSTPLPISLESILPQELIDNIIDQLGSYIASDFDNHSTEFKALQNCALVSRSFRSRATCWVFFRASILGRRNDGTWIYNRVEGFLNILIANPSIGGSVCELFIKATQIDLDFWLKENPSLVAILGRLSRIQRFDLRYGLGLINWEALPSTTETALRCMMQSPSMRFLELHDIREFPWVILAGCSALKDLALRRVYPSRRNFIVPSSIAPMLESVCINIAYSTAESLLAHPVTARMFSQLRTLSIGLIFLPEWETRAAAKFVNRAAHTVETLNVITLNIDLIDDENWINLSQLPALRHLNILRCDMPMEHHHGIRTPQFPSSLFHLLNLRGSSSSIQTIAAHLEYEDVGFGTVQDFVRPDHDGWANFDAILADENYRALEKVTLNLAIRFIGWNPRLQSMHAERIQRLPDSLFPAVKASGRVEVHVVVNISGHSEPGAP